MQTELSHVQALPPSLETEEKEAFIQFALQEQLAREELLWKQKSRVDWLTMPDLNTRLFHLSTIIRRRNSIDYLKAEDGRWLDNRQDIGDHIYDYFKSLFQSSHPVFDSLIWQSLFLAPLQRRMTRDFAVILLKKKSLQQLKVLELRKPQALTVLLLSSIKNFGPLLRNTVQHFFLTRVICSRP